MPHSVQVGPVTFGSQSLPLIAGPCVIESRDHALKMAEAIHTIAKRVQMPYIYKSSFDKANRTSIHSYRGPGQEEGLRILEDVRKETGVPVLTDVHLPDQVSAVAQTVDILQIPAFLSRQTDLLVAAGKTGKPVNVKKGQFLSPEKMVNIAGKLESTGNTHILLTERGTFFGYQELVNDFRSIPIMQSSGYPVIFDATHSVQAPGLGNEKTGGSREFIPTLARAAVAAGCQGLYMEVHDTPSQSRSDTATQWPLEELESLLRSVMNIFSALNKDD